MVTGGNGPNGAPAARPVDQEIKKDLGNVTHLLLLTEAKNAKEFMGSPPHSYPLRLPEHHRSGDLRKKLI